MMSNANKFVDCDGLLAFCERGDDVDEGKDISVFDCVNDVSIILVCVWSE